MGARPHVGGHTTEPTEAPLRRRARSNRAWIACVTAACALLALAGARADCPTAPSGDLNASGSVDITDVQCMLLVVLSELANTPLPGCLVVPLTQADLGCDGMITISDAQLTIAFVLGQPLAPVVDTDGNGCVDLCEAPPCTENCPGEGDCCAINPTEGCQDVDCQGCVCALDDFCCSVTWDSLCADTAAAGACAAECGCVTPPTGQCCLASGQPGCVDDACEDCVCGADPWCCENSWDSICVGAAVDGGCAADCGCQSLDPGRCCRATGQPGCSDATCEACVCATDSWCCDSSWDELCAGSAAVACAASCGCGPVGVPACCGAKGQPGCPSDANCGSCVCGSDSYCCAAFWDETCVTAAYVMCPTECECP